MWSSLLDVRDWVTWIYIPLIVLLFGVLPLFAYRMYRHARLDAALTRAVAEMREDFRRMLTLLEFGPAAEFAALPVQDVDVFASFGPGRAGHRQRHADYRPASVAG